MIRILLALLLAPSLALADATVPTLPAEFAPGPTPTPATTKSVCATVNITGATNASPIVITTAGHKWVTGQTVIIASVGGNTAANGTRVVTKISATQFSLNGTTGNGAYTSGGTAACDYSDLQVALDAATAGWTLNLNQGEIYTAPLGNDSFDKGFIFPAKNGPTYTILRTYDDGLGNLPADGERANPIRHRPYMATIRHQFSPNSYGAISCKADADFYWIKAINFELPPGGYNTSIAPFQNDFINCSETGGSGWSNPTKKWVSSSSGIVDNGSTVTITFDAARVGATHHLDPPQRVFLRCPVSCGVTGLADVPVVVTSANSTTITFDDPGMGGTYTYDASHYVEVDSSMYPRNFVIDQAIAVVRDLSYTTNQRWMNSFWSASGSNVALINSYIELDGHAAGSERGKPLLCATGCQRVLIQNNYMSSTTFSFGLVVAETFAKGYDPEDWVIRGNTITRELRWLHNLSDTASNYNPMNFKNLFEFKHMRRALIEGNTFSNGWSSAQSTMLHLTNVSNDSVNVSTCGASTGVEGEGCHPEGTLEDITFRNNLVRNVGDICFDIIGQSAQTGTLNTYAHHRANRLLVDNNLFINCGGWPYHSKWKTQSTLNIGAVVTGGGPQNVTVRHNTFIPMGDESPTGPWKSPTFAWFKAYCSQADNPTNTVLNPDGVTRQGTVTGCPDVIGATTQHASGKLPNLTIIDNVVWGNSNANAGAFAFASTSSGSLLGCRRDNAFDLMTDSTGVWHHNIIVGAVPGTGATRCDMNVVPGTEVLSTGSVVVANSAAMNYLDKNARVYKLTPSSPGYQAASDGTDVGVNWDTLMAAVTRFK